MEVGTKSRIAHLCWRKITLTESSFGCLNINILLVRLIITWKRKIKIVDFCEKLENKLRHVLQCLLCGWKNFLWWLRKKNFSQKNNERWRTSTHKNEYEMNSISSHASTYFPTFHKNTLFLFSFSMLLSNTPLGNK